MSASNIQRKHLRENVSFFFFFNDLLTTVEPQFITLGTRGFSRVQRGFSVLAEGNLVPRSPTAKGKTE